MLLYITLALLNLLASQVIPQVAEGVVAVTDTLIVTLATLVNASVAPFANEVNSRVIRVEDDLNAGIAGVFDSTRTALNSTVGVFIRGFQEDVARVFQPVPPLAAAIRHFGDCVVDLDGVMAGLEAVKDVLKIELLRVDLDMLKIEDMSESIRMALTDGRDGLVEGGLDAWIMLQMDGVLEKGKDGIRAQLWSFWFSTVFGALVAVFGLIRLSVWWDR